jgi:Tol biopolymer transport system component
MKSGTLARRPAVLLALGLCAFGGVVTLLGRLASGPVVAQKRIQFTTETGAQAYPAFSPDGKQCAYSAQTGVKDQDGFHIFVRPVPEGAPRQLTSGSANDIGPVWSPDGSTIAFLRVEEGRAQVMTMAAGGGAARKAAEFDAPGEDAIPTPGLAWTRDGRSLAVVMGGEKQAPSIALVPAQGGEPRKLTNPPEGSQGDASPAISPDGLSMAFVRNLDEDRADIYLCDLKGGALRQLTFDNHQVRGLAWSEGGNDLIYSANRGNGWRLWRLPSYGGSPRDLMAAGNRTSYPAVAPKGHMLAFTESPAVSAIWMARIGEPDAAAQEQQVIRSAFQETGAAWSPDGKKIANISEQTGAPEIWVGEINGSNRVQVTRLDGPRIRNPRWSPDGNTILFETRGQRGVEIYTVPAAGGKVTRILADASDASWSRDGKRIYYSANAQIWHADRDGSHAEVLTHRFGSGAPEESADGKWIYYRSRRTIWRVPPGGGKEEEVIVPDRDLMWAGMQAVKGGLYYNEWDRGQRAVTTEFYDFATSKSRPVLRVKNGDFSDGFSVSPDGKYVLYPKTDRNQTNVVLVENFR